MFQNQDIIKIFINPIDTLLSSNLILDFKMNFPNKKVVFYGDISDIKDEQFKELVDEELNLSNWEEAEKVLMSLDLWILETFKS